MRDGLARAVGSAFDVQAVPTPAAAAREVRDQDLYGVYVPAAQPGATATAIVAAASGTAVEALFRAVAAQQYGQLAVRDVRPLPAGDACGQHRQPVFGVGDGLRQVAGEQADMARDPGGQRPGGSVA